jgi:hypothetical protein
MQMRFYTDPARLKVREFFVDLLGSLVPGFIFIFLAGLALGWPLAVSCATMVHCSPEDSAKSISYEQVVEQERVTKARESYDGLVGRFRFEVAVFVITLSYVVGHICFRRTPKIPDLISVWRTKGELVGDKPAVQLDEAAIYKKRNIVMRIWEGVELFFGKVPRVVKKLAEAGKIDAQFPYLRIYEYLEHRGLQHLADIIKWKGDDPSSHPRRSKAFINLLKIRLEFAFPEKCGNITRNEAHIRLMSSMWYASCYLQRLGILSFVLTLVMIIVGKRIYGSSIPVCAIYWSPLASSALIIVGMWFIRVMIEKFFHYQRVREIIYVLETAHFASKHGVLPAESDKRIRVKEILGDLD